MSMDTLKSEIARRYGTPAHVIDLDIVERNIARLQSACDGRASPTGLTSRRLKPRARRLRFRRARRGHCRSWEAEVLADAGIGDILISYNILGEEKLGRLGKLAGRVKMTVSADNSVVVGGLPLAAEIAGRPLDVLVECDTGRQRAGVVTPEEAVALARQIAAQPGLAFAGFLSFRRNRNPGNEAFLAPAMAGVRAAGSTRVFSLEAAPFAASCKINGVTEHRAGSSFSTVGDDAAGVASHEYCALRSMHRRPPGVL